MELHPSKRQSGLDEILNKSWKPCGLCTDKQFHDSRFTQQRASSPLLRAAWLPRELTDGAPPVQLQSRREEIGNYSLALEIKAKGWWRIRGGLLSNCDNCRPWRSHWRQVLRMERGCWTVQRVGGHEQHGIDDNRAALQPGRWACQTSAGDYQ